MLLTMGLGSIFGARRIILLAVGEEKAEPVSHLLSGELRTDCPATLLNLHPDVLLIADRALWQADFMPTGKYLVDFSIACWNKRILQKSSFFCKILFLFLYFCDIIIIT